MRKPDSVSALADFGRVRLSKSFFMRDFLFFVTWNSDVSRDQVRDGASVLGSCYRFSLI